MNLLGQYPLGTTVRLSDNSVAIVIAAGSVEELPHCPSVKVVLDHMGRAGSEEMLDLSVTAKDPDGLQVIEVLNAADYGIEVMDYIL